MLYRKNMPYTKITSNVFAVGGSNLSNSEDAMSYLVRSKKGTLILIDCGVNAIREIENNIKSIGLDIGFLEALILTHCHIDHLGSAHDFQTKYQKLKIYAHEWDKDAIEGKQGTEKMIAASWYGVEYKPIRVNVSIKEEEQNILIGDTKFTFIHTPGHTPGSMAVIVEDDNKKILFGQDIHGPFLPDFHSNIKDWAKSMKILLSKEADILAEGHFGIYTSKESVDKFIKSHLKQNGMI